MKRFFITILVVAILLTPGLVLAERNQDLTFNEYGFKVNSNTILEKAMLNQKVVEWETFPSQTNVPLDKMWTIEFSQFFTIDEIDAVVIERGNQFIPVTISKTASNKLVVSPRDKFAGNTDYILKVLLSNGNKYKMNFRTRSSNRNADIEPNNTYLSASKAYLNEFINGEITKGDVDFYKVEVPSYGTLNVNLTSLDNTAMELYLYGPDGTNNYSMKSRINFTQGGISEGLGQGVYYIKVGTYSSSSVSSYELEIDFQISNIEDDNGTANYLDSNLIDLNSSFTGHVGYFSNYKYGNYNDYFKIEVPSHGTLKVNLTSLNNTAMELYLYGPNGTNSYSMKSKVNFTQGGISEGLMPGTYYIRLTTYNSSDYSPYKLEVIFEESKIEDDNGTANYLDANLIDLNSSFTGHVGYFSGYGRGNYEDFFKIEVPSHGTLNIGLTSLNNTRMSMYLYGSEGTNGYSIKSKTNFTQGEMSNSLSPGTYYIKVTTYDSSEYSQYELKLKFDQN